jgi:hypothetical protein
MFLIGENEGDAIKMERYLKRQKSKKLLKKLIDPVYIPVGVLVLLVIPIAIGTHVRD